MIITAIVLLLVYQGYTLSITGVAAPWIAKSFSLDAASLAKLFAWMSVSAFGSLLLARLADRIGRRRIILATLVLSPLMAAAAACSYRAPLFALFEILIAAMLGGSVSSAIVVLAEELPVEKRARGQAFAALASAIGGVLAYILVPFLLKWDYSWRWLLAPCVAGIGLVIPVARMLPDDPGWHHATKAGGVKDSHFYDILHPLYRRRALTLLACAALDTIAGTAVNGWLYFEAVSIIGLSPEKSSTIVVIGMCVGMAGFPAGAWTSERLGRVPTVMYIGGAAWLGAIAFYFGPPQSFGWPLAWLLAAYCWFKAASGVMTVGANSAATELFPAALRTTMIGWQMISGAIFAVVAQAIIAALTGPFGLAVVIRYMAFLGFGSAILFGLFIDETRGLPLEISAKEEAWAQVNTARHDQASRATATREALL
ncbi:MAG TPA: MFS transporter [Candidatus Binataceae bacterium]|nr:MFS transporter [Candidatus Binataceae bacterium]